MSLQSFGFFGFLLVVGVVVWQKAGARKAAVA